MKFQTPNGSSLQSTGLLVVAVVAGAMASRAGLGLIHDEKTGLTAAQTTTQNNAKLIKRGGIAAVGFGGASAIKGDDTASILLKGLGYGMAGMQIIDGVTDLAGKSGTIATTVAKGTTVGKLVGKGLGLKCPCDNMTVMPLAKPRKRNHSLRSPELVNMGDRFNSGPIVSPWQSAIDKGLSMQ